MKTAEKKTKVGTFACVIKCAPDLHVCPSVCVCESVNSNLCQRIGACVCMNVSLCDCVCACVFVEGGGWVDESMCIVKNDIFS